MQQESCADLYGTGTLPVYLPNVSTTAGAG